MKVEESKSKYALRFRCIVCEVEYIADSSVLKGDKIAARNVNRPHTW